LTGSLGNADLSLLRIGSDRIGSATRAAKVGQRRRRGDRMEPEVPREGRRSGRRRVWLGEGERSAERERDRIYGRAKEGWIRLDSLTRSGDAGVPSVSVLPGGIR
jgi:hypothetical protein